MVVRHIEFICAILNEIFLPPFSYDTCHRSCVVLLHLFSVHGSRKTKFGVFIIMTGSKFISGVKGINVTIGVSGSVPSSNKK